MNTVAKFENLKDLIVELRGQSVLLDADVAEIYGVETKRINEAPQTCFDFVQIFVYDRNQNLREVSMQRLVIHVKDDTKLNALMSVLNEINFIEVEREGKGASGLSRHGDLRKLFGIWENRDISLADIRQKAWR
jgi:hypothetical protein